MEKKIKLTSNGAAVHLLSITNEAISFSGKTLLLKDVTGVRFGLKPMEFYHFHLGSKFIIEFCSPTEKITLTFKNYFGTAWIYFRNLFNEIVDTAATPVITRMLDESRGKLHAGESVNFGHVILHIDGLTIYNTRIPYTDLHPEFKKGMITLNSKSNHKVYINLSFIEDFNTVVIGNLIEQAMEQVNKKK